MSLLDRIRKTVRVTASEVKDSEGREPGMEGYIPTYSSLFDDELLMLIGAAEQDLLRVGIREALVHPADSEVSADIEQCITLYVKCHFGYDNAEAPRFGESYRMAVCDLMNSPANSAAYEPPIGDIDPAEPSEPSEEGGNKDDSLE